jgi:putative heme transporter
MTLRNRASRVETTADGVNVSSLLCVLVVMTPCLLSSVTARRRRHADRPAVTMTPQLRRLARVGYVLALLAGVTLDVRGRLPIRHILSAIGRASPTWIGVAILAELGSMAAASSLYRRLLLAAGARLGWPAMLALTYASNAVSGSLPAGSAFGTAYTYRQLRRRHIDEAVTTWVLTFAGITSAAGLLVLTAIGLLAGPLDTVDARLLLGAVLAAMAGMIGVLACDSWRAWTTKVVALAIRRVERVALRFGRGPHDGADTPSRCDLVTRLRAARLGRLQSASALTAATSNWALDWVTLVASLAAIGVPITLGRTLLVYATVQLVGAASVLPGNLGLAEGGLTLAVAAAGAPVGTAVAGVLLYRVISYWLLLPLGWCAWLILRGHLGLSLTSAHRAAAESPPPLAR